MQSGANATSQLLVFLLGTMLSHVFAFSSSRPLLWRQPACLRPNNNRSIKQGWLLFSTSSEEEQDRRLIHLAKQFINNKNAAGSGESTLDGVFDMCSPSVDLYGLKGDDVRPGFISFFDKHVGLHHELLDEPTVVRQSSGNTAVQYPFVKRWNDGEEDNVWKSIDPAKPRNKVERLSFDTEGKLEKASVVEAGAPLD